MKIALIAAALMAFAGTASAAGEPAAAKVCLGCHQVNQKVFGPAFKDVADKYRGNANAEAHIVGVIQNGSKGVWTTFTMTPQKQVSPEDAKTLAKWIMSL